jgi:predicted PhzF superfamily epimerase YddE/YHI9
MRIFQVDAFTSHRYTGNPVTVVLDAERLSEPQHAQIAREFAHAETAFVLPPLSDDHDVHVRFFNSRKEAAFVGHATLAVHHVLLSLGLRGYGVHRQKSRLGVISVSAVRVNNAKRNGETQYASETNEPKSDPGLDSPFFEFRQTAAELDPALPSKDVLQILRALGLPQEHLHQTLPAVVARKGSTRLLLPLGSPDALGLIKPDFPVLVDMGAALGIEGYFPFALEQKIGVVRTRSRMFCPALGIPEDPVSGNAHAMLATYLWRQPDLRPFVPQFTGLQGDYVNRPGAVNVRIELANSEIVAAHIGGLAVTVSEGNLTEE